MATAALLDPHHRLVDITKDRTEQEIAAESTQMDNATRTALAFVKEADEAAGLALVNRYADRHDREWHRAIDKLRAIQKERHEQASLPNEPEPDLSPAIPITSEDEPARCALPLATHHSELEVDGPAPTCYPDPCEQARLTKPSDPSGQIGNPDEVRSIS